MALSVLALHLACGSRYGFFRDELYFVVCGKHPAWGYVDQPPVIAVVARFAWWMSGEGSSVLAFRLVAMRSHVATVLLAGRLAKKLGGGGFASTLAAAGAAWAPIQLTQGHLVTMNTLELTLWMAVALLAVTAVDGHPRAWWGAGGLLGLALMTKYSALFFAVALVFGLLLTRARTELKSKELWMGVSLAALIALPSALWQLHHGLPFLELLRNGQATKNVQLSLGALVQETLLEQGLGGGGLAALGMFAFWRLAPLERFRFLGAALLILLVGLVAMHAKPYYLAPAFTPLFAAGAVQMEAWIHRAWVHAAVVGAVIVLALPVVPLVLPILPINDMLAWQQRLGQRPQRLERKAYSDVPQHFADQFGWRERVASVAALAKGAAAEAVYAGNYGEAAAIDLFGPRLGLPQAVSGHNAYALWGVRGEPQSVLALGGERGGYVQDFATVALLGVTPEIPEGMPYESRVPVFLLRGPRKPLAVLLEGAKHFE